MKYGEGVSIASQRRWVRYVEIWAGKLARTYTPCKVEIRRIEFWGLRIWDGGNRIEVGISGFVDGPKTGSKAVNKIHLFEDKEVLSAHLRL